MKKLTAILLISALLLTVFSGCAAKGDTAEAQKVQYVYKAVSETLPEDLTSIQTIRYRNDRIYLFGEEANDDYSAITYKLFSMKPDGSDVQNIPLEILDKMSYDYNDDNIVYYENDAVLTDVAVGAFTTIAAAVPETTAAAEETVSEEDAIAVEDDDFSYEEIEEEDIDDVILPADEDYLDESWVMQNFAIAPDGSLWYIEYHSSSNYSEEDYFFTEDYTLVHTDAAGQELFRCAMNDFFDDAHEYQYINNFLIGDDGLIYIVCNDTMLLVLNDEGAEQFRLTEDESDTNPVSLVSMALSGSGKVICCLSDYASTCVYREVDTAAHAYGRETTLVNDEGKTTVTFTTILPGFGAYDFCVSDSIAVYGVTMDAATKTPILNFVNSDMNSSNSDSILPISDTQMLCITYDLNYEHPELQLLTHVPDEEVTAKKIIVFGTTGIYNEVKQAIINFNKTNENYRIEIRDYSSLVEDPIWDVGDDYEEYDWEAAMKKLNSDIVSGNIPDIIQIDSNMPYDSYVAKGLLTDLYTYLDKDEELKRDDLVPNVLTAMETDGKLYSITPSFSVMTVVGKTSLLGDRTSWTMDDMTALLNGSAAGTKLFDTMERETFLELAMTLSGDTFINWEKGTCDFNTPAFQSLLELAAQFPEEIDYESMYNEDFDWLAYENQYRNNNTLLEQAYLYDFAAMYTMEQSTFGETVSLIGFPVNSGSGSALELNLQLAISASSKCKDGAWAFLKTLFTEDYQTNHISEYPVRLSTLQSKMASDIEPETYTDEETGEEVVIPNTIWVGEEEVDIGYPTMEYAQGIYDFITSLTGIYRTDSSLMDIITEETGAYFAGQKSAADVAGIIQSKVTIYLSEGR